MGTHERFIGFLIEHYGGNFPLWLAPDQVAVLTVGDGDLLTSYAKGILEELRVNFVRASIDLSADKIGAKIQRAEKARTNIMLIVGNRETSGTVSVRIHGKGNVGSSSKDVAVTEIIQAVKRRSEAFAR